MAKTRYRVCVVDDDVTFWQSFASHVQAGGYETVSFGSAVEFFSGFHTHNTFCLLIASSLRGMSGMELLETLRGRKLAIPIIILTRHASIALAVQALKNGAMDVLRKPPQQEVLLDRLRHAFETWLNWQKIEKERQEVAGRTARLTPREWEVFYLMADGLPNTAIASQLGISRKTLDIHRANVLEKMKARTRADLARWRILLESGPGGTITLRPGGYIG
jgi:two-component system response regulator FixJ